MATGREKAITDLRQFAKERGIELISQSLIASEAAKARAEREHSQASTKQNFDRIVMEAHREMYEIYKRYQWEYERAVFGLLVKHLIAERSLSTAEELGSALGENMILLDGFFKSIAQGRFSRAGGAFEHITKTLFKFLEYPFDEQVRVKGGTPDLIIPSKEHFERDAPDCIIFTSKRTTRERWRQITTEGAAGLAFYLTTIDPDITAKTIENMRQHKIYLVIPEEIKDQYYKDANSVLTFRQFFKDRLDPKVEVWKRNKVI